MYFARYQFVLDKRCQLLLIHRDREDRIYKVREIHYPIFCQVKYSSRNLDHFERYTETKLVESWRALNRNDKSPRIFFDAFSTVYR